MRPLKESPYSRHFNVLLFLSAWIYETDNQKKLIMFLLYKLFMIWVALWSCFALVWEFYTILGDIKKMVWNICVAVMFISILAKSFQLSPWYLTINKLRKNLHRDEYSRRSLDDVPIINSALKELKILQLSFYGTAILFIPIWLWMRYSRPVRELPVPFHLPFKTDLEDDRQYNFYFFVVAFLGVLGLTLVLETELASFSILVQISREYRFLYKDILQLNVMYEDSNEVKKAEINPRLRIQKTHMMVKRLSSRQNQLIEYTNVFENSYNQTLISQFFAISVMIVTLALQCMMETIDFSEHIIYEMAYLFLVITDMFVICWFSSRLKAQCYEVGEKVYFTLWYKMEQSTQKALAMMILRSQHPPKITTGKLMELSLNAFMHRMISVYSWLTLIQQTTKNNQ